MSEQPRKWYAESGEPRLDLDGVAWFQCDPPGTWYRWEDGKLITPEKRIEWGEE